MDGLRIKVFGGVQVQSGGERIEFSRHKTIALLVSLALTDERQSREALVPMFWPENTQARAFANLRQASVRSEGRNAQASGGRNPHDFQWAR